ncbi:MAG: hypothetical protein N2712_03905 [Brevinematales bacterium]|nr:hypothetical protein [Brevinematales bacterium]
MKEFDRLVEIVDILRSPNGCPWDRSQTLESIVENIIEEAYEVINSIQQRDFDKIKDETGDLLLQTVFISQISKELGKFSIVEVLENLNNKLINRHPHVFSDDKLPDDNDDALKVWESKKNEDGDILNQVPQNLPTLMYVYKVIQKAKRKNKLQLEEEQIKRDIMKLLMHINLEDNQMLEDLVLLILVLLSFRNIRMEISMREKFLKRVRKWI